MVNSYDNSKIAQEIASQRITRRDALRLLGSASAGAGLAAQIGLNLSASTSAFAASLKDAATRPLARGAPTSSERTALIEAFKQQSEGLQDKFEALTHKSDWTMPYRLVRPAAKGKLPLVVYLSGSGGLGEDNKKQLEFGNIYGTRIWLLPENQKRFPCYLLAPQTDRGWAKYDTTQDGPGPAKVIPGLATETVLRSRSSMRCAASLTLINGAFMSPGNRWVAPARGTCCRVARDSLRQL
jgi:hypothetical protein